MISWRKTSFFLAVVSALQLVYILYAGGGEQFKTLAEVSFRQHESDLATNALSLPAIHMTSSQCEHEFPKLYFELERAVAYWKARQHVISADDVDLGWRHSGAFKILVHENELRILETRNTFTDDGYRPRTLSILSQIQQALWAASVVGQRLPTIEASIVTDDISKIPPGGTHSIWTLTSHNNDSDHERHWLIPDFNFYSAALPASSWRDQQRLAREQDAPFTKKRPQAVWRGVGWSNEPIRHSLLEVTREKLWADTAIVDWGVDEKFMSIDDLCKYAFLVHTEGRSYSSRLDFLLNCNSLVVIHGLEWRTHFTHLLVSKGAEQNYVPVERDFHDLGDKVHWYLDNPEDAQRIINESLRTFRDRYLTTTAHTCYWRNLVTAYASVAFTPEIYEKKAGSQDLKLRGIPFEQFVHLRSDYVP